MLAGMRASSATGGKLLAIPMQSGFRLTNQVLFKKLFALIVAPSRMDCRGRDDMDGDRLSHPCGLDP